jgi:hypothetical protein
LDFPFYYLDPRVSKTPGARWWNDRLKWLLGVFAQGPLSRSILCVEYFPYHSRKFGWHGLPLESQSYGFDLVRSAIDRCAVIVIMRGEDRWRGAVDELKLYSQVFRLRSWQNVALSPNNLEGEGFKYVVSAICKSLG